MGESGALSLPAGAGSIGFSRRISAQPALNWLRRNPLGAFGAVILAALLVSCCACASDCTV